MSSNPFDWLNNINCSTESIWDESTSEKDYNSFMINRGLSQFRDTVLFSQMMNEKSQYLSNKMQYDFYRLGITHKKKRFAKWHKPEKLQEIEMLSKHFGINIRQMENFVSLMSETDYATLIGSLERGGRHGTKK
jgi:hypothetical protein